MLRFGSGVIRTICRGRSGSHLLPLDSRSRFDRARLSGRRLVRRRFPFVIPSRVSRQSAQRHLRIRVHLHEPERILGDRIGVFPLDTQRDQIGQRLRLFGSNFQQLGVNLIGFLHPIELLKRHRFAEQRPLRPESEAIAEFKAIERFGGPLEMQKAGAQPQARLCFFRFSLESPLERARRGFPALELLKARRNLEVRRPEMNFCR